MYRNNLKNAGKRIGECIFPPAGLLPEPTEPLPQRHSPRLGMRAASARIPFSPFPRDENWPRPRRTHHLRADSKT